MRSVPFLLLLQGPSALRESERICVAAEGAIGRSLSPFAIPEYDLWFAIAREENGGAPAEARTQRCGLPGGDSSVPGRRPLLLAIEHRFHPGPSQLRTGQPRTGQPRTGEPRTGEPRTGADLACSGPLLTARVLPALAGAAHQAELERARELMKISDVFALFDPERNGWTIGRSHPGLRTFYYQASRGTGIHFAASTQLRALLPVLRNPPTVDPPAISRYLCNGFFSDPETPFEELRSLVPGEVLRHSGEGGAWVELFSGAPGAPGASGSADERDRSDGSPTERVRRRLVEAVAAQTEDSPEAACMLSGGVDSSTVAAIAARLLGKKVHTYSLVFEDEALSEAKYASAVAARIGAKHENVLLKQADFEASLDDLLESLDLPTADAVNSLLICRSLAGAGHRVVLAGVGSDELFGGHECMRRVPRALALLATYRGLPRFAKAGLHGVAGAVLGRRIGNWLPSRGLRGKFMSLLDQEPDPLAVYLLSRRVLLPEAVLRLMPAADLDSFRSVPDRVLAGIEDAVAAQPLLKKLSYYEQEIYLRNQLLRDLGMVSVASGLDIRLPFLDRELIAAVWSLPASQVFLEGRPKTFLIRCVSDVLPIEAYDRPKLGFVLPIGRWLGGVISARLHGLTAQADLLELLGIDARVLDAIIDDCSSARGRIFYTREWALFVLLDWFARHLGSARSA